jgi:large subunit ribosomal protein L34
LLGFGSHTFLRTGRAIVFCRRRAGSTSGCALEYPSPSPSEIDQVAHEGSNCFVEIAMTAFQCLRVAARPATMRTTLLRPTACMAPAQRYVPAQDITTPQLTSSRSSIQSARSISLLAPRRPVLPPSSYASTMPTPGSTTAPVIPSAGALDLASKISAHPALGSMQIRCGPRDTFNPSHLVRKRRHGFLSRIRTKKGRKLLMRRLKKGRWNLSH